MCSSLREGEGIQRLIAMHTCRLAGTMRTNIKSSGLLPQHAQKLSSSYISARESREGITKVAATTQSACV
jgi:hypothetical protein